MRNEIILSHIYVLIARKKMHKYLAELEQLTITERLRLIEERLYDMAHAKKHQEFNPWTPIC